MLTIENANLREQLNTALAQIGAMKKDNDVPKAKAEPPK
jgi:hypothetical protein